MIPEKRVRPVLPNAGVESDYLAWLRRLIDEMHRDVSKEILQAYRERPPHAAAMDESPAARMRAAVARVTQRWVRGVNKKAPDQAKHFAEQVQKGSDFAFQRNLNAQGIVVKFGSARVANDSSARNHYAQDVKFRHTRAMNDALQAVIGENVGLIRSIPQEYLGQVQGIVMRAVQKGSDLKTLTEQLERRYHVARNRAELIARDQNAKATSVLNRARQRELGIKQAVWRHTPSSVNPRESHLEADGTVYDIQQGCFIDGEFIQPGEEINCGCVSESVIPGLGSLDEDE